MERREGRKKENDLMKKRFCVFKSRKREVSFGFKGVNEGKGR